jgi:hypothetical protein
VLQPPIPAEDTTPVDRVVSDDVLVTKYGKGFRWWPSPESRKKGSQRWAVPSVSEWHPAASITEIGATLKALEST